MSAYFVYMLRCRGDVYYTGLTTDIARRYRLHLSGKGAKFTVTLTASNEPDEN